MVNQRAATAAPPAAGKCRIDDLAIFGGPPLFPRPLHVGRPNIGDRRRLFARLDAMLDRRWLTNDGPLVPEFEAEVARRCGVAHCVATCNATLALELVTRALGMSGEVIVPAFTFVAPVHALAWQGASPVFCDIDPVTHLLDPDAVEALITPRTTGILAVHLWGHGCHVDRLAAIARRHRLPLLFDAAHAFGCTDRGRPIGGFGDAEVLSFHATKIVNAFEGGAVVTNDASLANRIRSARSFGFTGVDLVEGVGTNAKMSEASAAMGLTSLESFDDFAAANRRHYDRYSSGLAGMPGLSLRPPRLMTGTTCQYVVAEIDADAVGYSRDLALRVLAAEGVLARRYFYPGCHRMEPYRAYAGRVELPFTDRVCSRVLQLPTGTAVQPEEIDAICSLLRWLSSEAPALHARLTSPAS